MAREMGQKLSVQRQSATEPAVRRYGNSDWQRPTIDALFQENTKLTPANDGDFERSIQRFLEDPGPLNVELLRPDYPFHEAVDLPETEPPDDSLADVLRDRESDVGRAATPMTVDALARLLETAMGVVEESDVPAGAYDLGEDATRYRRAYPSAGKLYPIECYVLVRSVPELAPGAYYYVPEDHRLRVVERFDDASRFETAFNDGEPVEEADVAVLLACVRSRVRAKYGPRGYRFALFEAGHAAQNLQLTATALGLGSTPYGGHYDDRANDLLGLDGHDASVVYPLLIAGDDGAQTGGGADA